MPEKRPHPQANESAILLSREAPGKPRSRALKKILESNKVIPAVRSSEGRVTRGLPGETHYHVLEREALRRGMNLDNYNEFDSLVEEYFKRDPGAPVGEFSDATGFSVPRSGAYLNRREAAVLVDESGSGYAESIRLHKDQQRRPFDERLAETRRGGDPQEAERLLSKRKQTGNLLRTVNDKLSGEANPIRASRLLNRRGLIKAIARKNRYLGLAIASGEAVRAYLHNARNSGVAENASQ